MRPAKRWTFWAILLTAFGVICALMSLVDSFAYRLLFLPASVPIGRLGFRAFDKALGASKTARRREAEQAAIPA